MTIVRSLALVLLAACTSFATPADLRVVQEVELAGRTLVGVAVAPDTGSLYVLDALEGVFRLDADGLVQVAGPQTLEREGADLRPFTDLVALGDDQFAVTVRNDGLLLDATEQTTKQHFCYLPGSDLEMFDTGMKAQPVVSQLTHAIAWDPVDDVLFAQPQTFLDASLESAQIGTYDRTAGGQPEGWFDLRRDDVAATGMIWDTDHLVLAQGGRLSTYRLGDDRPMPYADLSDWLGQPSIEGMALTADDHLVVVTWTGLKVFADWRP